MVHLLISPLWNKVSVMGADDQMMGLWTKDKDLAQTLYYKIQDGVTKAQLEDLGLKHQE